MSEVSKGTGAFAKAVQKTLARTKTKVLQRVGKAEKTSDETFKENVANFHTQQVVALRLQKELKHYITCARAMTSAASSLYAVLKDTYEDEWLDPHSVGANLNSLDLMQTNYEAELAERVFAELNSYIEQFPIYKEKINKRRRKLLDFDNAKHEYESLAAAKKPDHTKICKAQESLQQAKSHFEDINAELMRELPKFYDYRIQFLAANMTSLFSAEGTYHNNCGQLSDKMVELLRSMSVVHADERQRLEDINHRNERMCLPTTQQNSGSEPDTLDLSSLSASAEHQVPKTNGHNSEIITPPSPVKSTPAQNRNSQHDKSNETEVRKLPPARPVSPLKSPTSLDRSSRVNPFNNQPYDPPTPTQSPPAYTTVPAQNTPQAKLSSSEQFSEPQKEVSHGLNPFFDDEDSEEGANEPPEPVAPETSSPEGGDVIVGKVNQKSARPPDLRKKLDSPVESESKPSTSSTTSNESSILYQVMATHPYQAVDDDELSFEAGEIINVVEYDDGDEQDDGWLMGVSTKSSTKGVFPANFTQKIVKTCK